MKRTILLAVGLLTATHVMSNWHNRPSAKPAQKPDTSLVYYPKDKQTKKTTFTF